MNLETKEVLLEEIDANEGFNCRGHIAPIDVVDLMKSIAQHGLLEPVVVRLYDEKQAALTKKKYGLVAGFRRFKATQLNRETKIRATIHPNMDEGTARVINLQENLKRKDLNIYQEAKAIEQFKYMGWTRDRTARELDVSNGWVQVRFMLLDLPFDIQEVAATGVLNQTQIRDLYSMKTDAERYAAVKAIKTKKMKGESTAYITKKIVKNKMTKRERKKLEIFELQALLRDAIGPSILTRLLGWCAGEVSDGELHEEINEYLSENFGTAIQFTYDNNIVEQNPEPASQT